MSEPQTVFLPRTRAALDQFEHSLRRLEEAARKPQSSRDTLRQKSTEWEQTRARLEAELFTARNEQVRLLDLCRQVETRLDMVVGHLRLTVEE